MNNKYEPKKQFMKIAIEEAKKGKRNKEWIFGAVIVKDGKLISKSGNEIFKKNDSTGHAEIVAIRKAGEKLKTKNLTDCILYSTHEPCCMCVGAVVWANIKGVVFGANVNDLKSYFRLSGNKTKFFIAAQEIIDKKYPRDIFLIKNFMRKECKDLFNY